MSATKTQTIRIGHSPDPDDAFMWYPLADLDGNGPKIDTGRFRFEHVLEDIESLNQRSARGELEITALSIHQYPYVADRYALTSCGSSMGDGYGPMVVAKKAYAVEDLRDITLAVPGERTTAFLTMSLLMKSVGVETFNYKVVPFDEIIERVVSGEFDAGLIIHEGQLTYGNAGLEKVVDLGQWWGSTRGLPLPLGGNAIRRDLADDYEEICTILYRSIEYALEHRAEAIDYAMNYARDMGTELADEFVGMYVNQWTMDYGEVGRQAVQQLMNEASAAGLIPKVGEIDFVFPRL
ncbi:MAG: MqnA/MqnD/SBP family protein [Phycisphaeraceae bacterium]